MGEGPGAILSFKTFLSFINRHGNPLQSSCLEYPRDGGGWWAATSGVTQSWTWLKWLSSSSSDYVTSSWRLAGGVLFLPPSDTYVRSFLYLLYTLIKLYYTKALSDQASSLAPDWILLLPGQESWRRDSTTTFQYECKNGHKSQWNGIERLEINPHTYGQLIFNKGGKNIQWRKESFQQWS